MKFLLLLFTILSISLIVEAKDIFDELKEFNEITEDELKKKDSKMSQIMEKYSTQLAKANNYKNSEEFEKLLDKVSDIKSFNDIKTTIVIKGFIVIKNFFKLKSELNNVVNTIKNNFFEELKYESSTNKKVKLDKSFYGDEQTSNELIKMFEELKAEYPKKKLEKLHCEKMKSLKEKMKSSKEKIESSEIYQKFYKFIKNVDIEGIKNSDEYDDLIKNAKKNGLPILDFIKYEKFKMGLDIEKKLN